MAARALVVAIALAAIPSGAVAGGDPNCSHTICVYDSPSVRIRCAEGAPGETVACDITASVTVEVVPQLDPALPGSGEVHADVAGVEAHGMCSWDLGEHGCSVTVSPAGYTDHTTLPEDGSCVIVQADITFHLSGRSEIIVPVDHVGRSGFLLAGVPVCPVSD